MSNIFKDIIDPLEQENFALKVEVVELTAQVERLRGVYTQARAAYDWLEHPGNIMGVAMSTDDPIVFELSREKYHAILNAHDAYKTLSQPTPTGFGADVLALARAGYEGAESFYHLDAVVGAPIHEEYQHTCLTDFRARSLTKAAQPFLNDPEKRKWLGVE